MLECIRKYFWSVLGFLTYMVNQDFNLLGLDDIDKPHNLSYCSLSDFVFETTWWSLFSLMFHQNQANVQLAVKCTFSFLNKMSPCSGEKFRKKVFLS